MNNKRLLVISILTLVAIGVFVTAAFDYSITSWVNNATSSFVLKGVNNVSVNESQASYLINITINNTVSSGVRGNISMINITLPVGFTYVSNSMGNATSNTTANNASFSATSRVLMWGSSASDYIINGSSLINMWFNITVPALNSTNQINTLEIYVFNNTWRALENISISLNDTTAPVLTGASTNNTASKKTGQQTYTLTCAASDNFRNWNFSIEVRNGTGLGAVLSYNNSNLTTMQGANSTSFSFNITTEGKYYWSCNATDRFNNTAWLVRNRTFIIDRTDPKNVTLISPADASSSTDTSYNFTYQVYDTNSIDNCTLFVDGTPFAVEYNQSLATSNYMYNGTFSAAQHSWYVNCSDYAGNTNVSSTFKFTVTTASTTTTSSGGAAPAKAWTNTYSPDTTALESGYTRDLGAKERVTVEVGTSTHHVGVSAVTATTATITIESEPITLTMTIGEERKVDVNADGVYDISVTLNSITGTKANVTVKTITEEMPEGTTGTVSEPIGGTPEVTETPNNNTTLWIVIAIVVVLVIAGAVYYKKRK